MSDRWITGFDGSAGSVAALRWAVVNAPQAGAEVVALAARRGVDIDAVGFEAESRHLLNAATVEVGGSEVRQVVVDDAATSALLTAAADASLLIVGRRGGGLRQLVLGSVSTSCTTRADVPVIVVPPDWDDDPFSSVVVGFDGSEHACAALRWALEITPIDVPIELVMAIEPASWLSEEVMRARFPEEIANEERRLIDLADLIDTTARVARRIVLRDPRHALAEAAETADLVVVGARGRGRIGSALLGSVTTWLLHNARCAVAVVPQRDAD